MSNTTPTLNDWIAQRLSRLRSDAGLSLEARCCFECNELCLKTH
jgi:hypothetical protein